MKKNKKQLCITLLSLLLLLTSITGLIILPDIVPTHFNHLGKATKLASKYYNLFDVAIYLILSISLYMYSRLLKQKISTSNNPKYINDTTKNLSIFNFLSILFLIYFNLMNIYTLYAQYTYNENSSKPYNFYKIMMISLSVIFILIGNILPRLKPSSKLGIRTNWSKKNNLSWYYSQRYGGIIFIICGIVIFLESIFLNQPNAIIFMISTIILSTLASIVSSYFAYKKSIKNNADL